MSGRIVGWVALALLGLALAVALSVAASTLSTQPIGLSSEPLRAGDRLAPPLTVTGTRRTARRRPSKSRANTTTTPTTTAPSTTTTTTPKVEPGDDHGGRGSDD